MKRGLFLLGALLCAACGSEVEEASSAASSASSSSAGGSTSSATGGAGAGAGGTCGSGIEPKLHYRFDGDATNDGSLGSAHDGMPQQVEYTAGKLDRAVKLTGPVCAAGPPPESSIALPGTATVLASPQLTIGLWFREPTPPDTSCVMHLLNCRTATKGFETYQGVTLGELTTCTTAGDTAQEACRSFPAPLEQWHHLLYRYAGTSTSDGGGAPLQIYLDAELIVTFDNAAELAMFAEGIGDLLVGRFSFFEIDELKVYDTVFDEEDQCNEVIGGCWRNGACALP